MTTGTETAPRFLTRQEILTLLPLLTLPPALSVDWVLDRLEAGQAPWA